jgi:hypothetical protein
LAVAKQIVQQVEGLLDLHFRAGQHVLAHAQDGQAVDGGEALFDDPRGVLRRFVFPILAPQSLR